MASTQLFRRRIKSIGNTRQITRAMEMVSSVKMQKAQKAISEARSYVQNSWNMLTKLGDLSGAKTHPLLKVREEKSILMILITSDRGLCGSFNNDIYRKAEKFISDIKVSNSKTNIDIIGIGKKSSEYAKRFTGTNLIAEFDSMGQDIDYDATTPISKIVMDDFSNGKYDKVVAIYAHFVSSINQMAVTKNILPVTREHIDIPELWEENNEEKSTEYKFEPDPSILLDRLIPQFLRMQVYGAVLESNASEHSARMVAMKNATDNAKDLIDELTLEYNSIRQNSITSEIAEICAGAEAMK